MNAILAVGAFYFVKILLWIAAGIGGLIALAIIGVVVWLMIDITRGNNPFR